MDTSGCLAALEKVAFSYLVGHEVEEGNVDYVKGFLEKTPHPSCSRENIAKWVDVAAYKKDVKMLQVLLDQCKAAALALCGVMRKRVRIGGGYRVPRELVTQMARWVWDHRNDDWPE